MVDRHRLFAVVASRQIAYNWAVWALMRVVRMKDIDDASQFYSALVGNPYEPLAG